jgi:2-haloacid dehalogenase
MTPTNLDVDVVLFDVNETLSDLTGLRQAFVDLGLRSHLAALWFASVLRDGFALTAVGATARFADLGGDVLRTLLAQRADGPDPDEAVARVLGAFLELDVHPDVADGIRRLARGGRRVGTLSNGAARVAEALLTRAGVREHVEHVLSVEDAGAWKPHRTAYEYGLAACGVPAAGAALVAVHPWDVDGANRAGLRGIWLRRDRQPWPTSFPGPGVTVTSMDELATRLGC